MLFSRQMPPASVIALCRALRHNLGAGLTLVQVFRQQAERGVGGVRPLAERVLGVLEQGHGLSDALEREKGVIPPLLFSLVKVGEETGHLAEIFGELEKYFLLQDKLRKQFRSEAMMPVIQLGLAFLIIAGLILILGMIAASNPGTTVKGLFGLSGPTGAVLFLVGSFGSIGLLWLLSKSLGRLARQKPVVDALLLRVPGIGPCVEALVMGRFSMALHLTIESGMPIARALRLSLAATGNTAFTAQTEIATQAVKNGAPLAEALTRSGLFSLDFLSLVAVGEEGGRVPEVMRQQTDYWNEEASNRLKVATRLAGMLVWLIYALFMIGAIFSVARIYLGALGA
jgi:type II secretory pathway component PulF